MTKITRPLVSLATALVCLLPVVSAQAQVNRTFVSAAGSDSNNCANVATPCRHFAAAYAVTAPSGEIFVLDPANYGSVTIIHAVSIEGHGWASIAPPNNGNAITINAGPSDDISIHGVAIDGTGATGGTNGIVFNSGGSLTVADCVVQHFGTSGSSLTGNGILIQPTSGTIRFAITNTIASKNNKGISYASPNGSSANANGVIDHVTATNNGDTGIDILPILSSGATVVALSNSVSSNNFRGIHVNGSGSLVVSIDNVTASGNIDDGLNVGGGKVLLGRSVFAGNSGYGVFNATTPNSFYTYQDNRINWNNPDTGGPTLIAIPSQ